MVERALARGHEVTAVVRAANRLPAAAALEVVTADVMSPEAIIPAVKGRDAVVSAIGTRTGGFTTVCHDAIRSITEAMGAAGVRRVLAVSSALVTTKGDGPFTRTLVKPVIRRTLRHAVADSIRMEECLRASELDWTLVRPPRLTEGERGGYRTALGANVRGGMFVSRADLAAAVLDLLEEGAALRRAVGVAS